MSPSHPKQATRDWPLPPFFPLGSWSELARLSSHTNPYSLNIYIYIYTFKHGYVCTYTYTHTHIYIYAYIYMILLLAYVPIDSSFHVIFHVLFHLILQSRGFQRRRLIHGRRPRTCLSPFLCPSLHLATLEPTPQLYLKVPIGEILGLYWGYTGIKENKMETTI